MMPLTIRCAAEVYADALQCEIVRHTVEHSGIAALLQSLKDLMLSVGEAAGEEFWLRALRPVRRSVMALYSTPLPFNRAVAVTGLDFRELERLCWQARLLYPDSAECLSAAAAHLRELTQHDSNPLMEPLQQLSQGSESICLVLRNPGLNRPVKEFFSERPELSRIVLASSAQLREGHRCEALAILGPCSWFPEHVFTAPRARCIHAISLSCLRDGWKPEPLFLHSADKKDSLAGHRVGRQPGIRESGEPVRIADTIEVSELMPGHGHSDDLLRGRTSEHVESGGEELVLAQPCLIGTDCGVFLDAAEKSSALVIDTGELGHAQVHRVIVDELEPGMYLVLRTSGGGDYIMPLADRIMGKAANEARRQQSLWKDRFKVAAIARFGTRSHRELVSSAVPVLRKMGAVRANENNIYYWLSPKCIRTRYVDDFAAVLKFAGLDDQAEDLWKAMAFIDRAHRRAGHVIRQMLLKKIGESSLEELERDGVMQFDLGEQGGGSLTAYRIAGLLPKRCEVPASHIGVPFELEA